MDSVPPVSDAPRIRVAALTIIDGRVLTVRHAARGTEYHLLPGGGVEWGESLPDALVREVEEETGLLVSVGRLIFLSDTISPDGRRHIVHVTFACDVTGGEIRIPRDDYRIVGVDLVDPAELTTMDLRPPIADEVLGFTRGELPDSPYLGSRFRAEQNFT